MAKVRKEAMETVVEGPAFSARRVEWSGMTFAFEQAREAVDPAPLFAALPNGRCHCPHWGYVLEGEITFSYADHDEIVGAGEVYYAAPGHVPRVERSAAIIELSPTEQLQATLEAVQAALAANGAPAAP